MRHASIAVGLVLGLVACAPATSSDATGFALSSARTCAHDVVPYDTSLLTHLVANGDGTGALDHTGEGVVASVAGSYDLVDGTFDVEVTYDEGFRETSLSRSGNGVVYPDGDVDLVYTDRVKLSHGPQRERTHREVRTGCDVEIQVTNRNGELARVETGEILADRYAYTSERTVEDVLVTTTGERFADGEWVEEEAYRSGRHERRQTATGTPDGRVVTDFVDVFDGVASEGRIVLRFDGTERYVFERAGINGTGAWDYVLDPTGDGQGTVTFTPSFGSAYDCEVQWDAFACIVECPGLAAETCIL